jgi:ketopantoate hydroxymethyltransferase
MRNHSKIVRLSTALAALAVPAATMSATEAAATEAAHQVLSDAKAPSVKVQVGEDLMSFTVTDNGKGVVVADHESHASHASHESHASHASGM